MRWPPLYRSTLANGLRVVVQPLDNTLSVGVAVHYGVGFRAETPGRSGFAHLFEHMMFQGSDNVGPADHFRHVQASGGTANGSTYQDYTDFFQVVPAPALDLVLFLEADRMRALHISQETLSAQTAVVEEEIRQTVENRPYGGFPWTVLPSALYSSFANAHNGYGVFEDLEAVTVDECREFFDTYYCPGNAVVTICGKVTVAEAFDLVDRHFGEIPGRPVPPAPDLAESETGGGRHVEHHDPHATVAATALGYRIPDVGTDPAAYFAHMVLTQLLSGRDTARLKQRMIHRVPLVTDVSTSCGLFGPLRARAPETFVCVAMHTADVGTGRIIEAVDSQLDDLAVGGPGDRELAQVKAQLATATWRSYDDLAVRTRALGTGELLFGSAGLVADLGPGIDAVGTEHVMAAAAGLRPDRRAVLSLVPGGGGGR